MNFPDAAGKARAGRATLIPVPTFVDGRGALSVADEKWLPFKIRRLYWLHSNQEERLRGFHAHKALRQFMLAMSGRITVEIDNGDRVESFVLESPDIGILVDPIVWREIRMPPGSVLAVLASEPYDEADYIRDRDEFLRAVQ